MSLIATATTDDAGVVTGWSEGARRLLGYERDEVVGRPVTELLTEDDGNAVWSSLADRQSWKCKAVLRHRDGRHVAVVLLAQHRVAEWWFMQCSAELEEKPRYGDEMLHWGYEKSPCVLAIYDTDLRLVSANADMRRAVALPEEQMCGLRMSETVPHPESEKTERAMRRVMESGQREHLVNFLRVPGERREHAWSVSLSPLTDPDGRLRGVCFAAYDITEQHEARQRLSLLNKASTVIGSTLDMARTAQELVDMAVPQFADYAAVDLLAAIDSGDDPPASSLSGPVVLRRVAQQSVLDGVPESTVEPGGLSSHPQSSPTVECLVTGRARRHEITDPALTQWLGQDPSRAAKIRDYGFESMMEVPIAARGTPLGVAHFFRHRRPEPFQHDDLLLAEEISATAAVAIDNARRYTRERTTAVALQRNLLPQKLPEQTALDIASRYSPAGSEAGVGGDWFDVVPLSGARIALVIGDVVGHGLQASATMGRLRTAVRTLADIDLAPDELLTHLDDLVIRTEAATDSDSETAGAGTTCLYAVYDPVSRRCVLARAGHLPPVVVSPDGTSRVLDLPAGPPLGLGGLPFESAEVDLPEGSLLALYTDGLIKAHGTDVDKALTTLRHALARPAPSLEVTCDTALRELIPTHPDDDIALLVARTHGLGSAQVAAWELPSDDPAIVAQTRQSTRNQLTVWGLEEATFTTELVVSELVTNAIRYGQLPIRLRLILDRGNLICEVSDGSSTAPHLRRARTFDEGGRGLLLVAQLAQRWGTRHAREGKTIWAEQHLANR
ncbi:SpoIIE family protein phosphatase [Streptomyces krungchingensis]